VILAVGTLMVLYAMVFALLYGVLGTEAAALTLVSGYHGQVASGGLDWACRRVGGPGAEYPSLCSARHIRDGGLGNGITGG
jgi:hypothetical protein